MVVLVLGGAAERWACPADESPLALAETPHLDRLATEGRVFAVQLIERPEHAANAAPLVALLGCDPEAHETACGSYLGALSRQRLVAGECFVSANFVSLFRDLVADPEPGHLRAAEIDILLKEAGEAVSRAGFRLLPGRGAHHLAIAPLASVDPLVPSADALAGKPFAVFEPRVEQHAFAHRLAREALDGHEINEVRRDLGDNGADAVWIWGPGGRAVLEPDFGDDRVSAFGTAQVWRGVCQAAGIPLRSPSARTPAQLVRGVTQALKRDRVIFVYARRGVRDALLRERRLRAHGVSDLDRHLVGPIAAAVEAAGGRMVVLPDAARDTVTGQAMPDPVPVLVWGKGIDALTYRPFTEAGASSAGEPIAPGHGLLAYVRHL